MYKVITLFALLTLWQAGLRSQDQLNTFEVDERSYELYQKGEWKSLIRLGREAGKQGIDFYYLQYRMGIAFYELRKYRQAIPCFEEVIKQYPDDVTAREYLYFSYIFSGRPEDARILSLRSDPAFRQQMNVKDKASLIDRMGVEYKYYQFDDFTVPGSGGINDVEQKIRKSLNYTNLNFTHLTRSRFTLFHSFSFLWGQNIIHDPAATAYEYEEYLKQYQYYLAPNWHLGKGFDMAFAFHYIHTVLEGLNPERGQGNQNYKYLYITKENAFAGLMKLSKSFSLFNIRASVTISNLNGGTQYLPLAGFDFYPLGNANLYISSDVAYLVAPDETRYSPGLVLKGKLGIRLFKPFWIEGFGQYGKVSNYADEDAFVIYNSRDVIDYWYGARLNLFLSDFKINLYYIFQYYQMGNTYSIGGLQASTGYTSLTHLVGLRFNL